MISLWYQLLSLWYHYGHNQTIRYYTDCMSQLKYAGPGEALIQWGDTRRWHTCIWVWVWMSDQILTPTAPLSLTSTAVCGLMSFWGWNREGNTHSSYTMGKEGDTLGFFSLISEGLFSFPSGLCLDFPTIHSFAAPNCGPSHLLGLSQCECWKLSLTSSTSSKICSKFRPKRIKNKICLRRFSLSLLRGSP